MNRRKIVKFVKDWAPPKLLVYANQLSAMFWAKKFEKLLSENKKLLNPSSSKRCFILGSGPSVLQQDLELLRDEDVFFLNNFYVNNNFSFISEGAGNKYYLIAPIHPPQVEEEWTSWLVDIARNVPENIVMLLGHSKSNLNIKRVIGEQNVFLKNKKYYYLPLVNSNNLSYVYSPKHIDPTTAIIGAGASSVYALTYAVYMGYSEIYLLGMDHNYFMYDNESEMRFYRSAVHQKNEMERTFFGRFYIEEFLRQYQIFNQYSLIKQNTNSIIFNCSNNSVLKVFDFVKYEDIF